MEKFPLRLPADLKKKAQAKAKSDLDSLNTLIIKAISQYIKTKIK